jgi:hypothetical protein
MTVEVTIELDFRDLTRLAANSQVEKNGVTIKIGRPILPMINGPALRGDEYVLFSLDSGDPRSKDFKWDADIPR